MTEQVLAIKAIDFRSIPDGPGAVAIVNDGDVLYVAATGGLEAWTRRLLDRNRPSYVRTALAKAVFPRSKGISDDHLDDQVLDLLEMCQLHMHPEADQAAASERKKQLMRNMTPIASRAAKMERNLASGYPSEDEIRYVLRMAGKLSHLDDAGRPRMVDVTAKPETAREATAKGSVYMSAATLALATSGRAAKGDVLTTARLAGIMAAKRTHELIPLCHPLPLTAIEVDLTPDDGRSAIDITATVRTTAKTGVEMEALTAVTIAALTVYDMLKAAQKDMQISDIRLVRKTGGKSGDYDGK
jgi:cyclic pyranopterin phosphate synthase